jgi:Cu/Zn superoxide dismutase
MIKFRRILILLTFCLVTGATFANHLSGNLLFTSRFSGDQEVPPVETDATGVGSYFLNASMDTLCITITVNGLSGPITGAHIHEGMMGMNGGVLVGLTDNVDGNSLQATITGDDLTPELLEAMLNEGLYFNIHTDANPAGEIRGQILLETDQAYTGMLDAEQEVADVESDATGLATFNLSKSGMEVNYRVVVQGLTGPIMMAHLHNAPAGVDGPVVVDLGDGIDGNVISGSFDPTQFDNLLEQMNAGEIYINVHTAQFPAGEIRGQLMLNDRLVHDAYADVAQEIPAPTMEADGNGLAIVALNYTLDTLFYDVQVEGLTGPITGAHFHEGALGETGPVLIGVTDDVDGNLINGFVTGAALTTENIVKFLSGAIYLNVHTDANPAGEIRGQVYKLAREGYTYELTGDQEVPSVDTEGYGSGIVSIDRDQTNVHFMMAYNDLSGPQTVAHFHNAPAGQNGGVIFDLGPFFDQTETFDAAFGYWTDMDETPFDAAAAEAFREAEVYVNIHSDANPAGELRGQVDRMLTCSSTVTGIFDQVQYETLGIYPNPSNGLVNIDVSGLEEGTFRLRVSDITGKQIESRVIRTNGAQTVVYQNDNLDSGIYFLNINSQNTAYSAKLIIQ